jgi:serine/threonine-protein kinase
VVHRDIKPENILLSGGTAVVTDFGIAKAITASKTQAPGGTLTVVGTSLGTPAYMAPEQAVGDTVDQRADIYAWGVIAYELLSGKHPFGSKTTAQQLIAAHIAEKPQDLAEVNRDIPAPLAALVMRALEKSPDARPQSAQEIQKLLDDPGMANTSGPQTTRAGIKVDVKASSPRSMMVLKVAAAVIVVALAVVAIKAMVKGKDNSPAVAAAAADSSIHTVAVLPFVNTGGDPKDEYFSDGMTDELARALSKLPDVHVASRTSAYSFKGKNTNAQEIGKALNVAGIVEGTVRRAGDRLRVSAQLTNANTGLVIWSDGFERSASNVFEVQDDLTAAIVGALSSQLRSEKQQTLASESRGTNDREAYDLYLRGRFNWNKRKADALEDALSDLNAAVARDPKFARAYAALASTYAILPEYSPSVNKELERQRGVEAAKRALELDPSLAEPHTVLGFIHMASYKWDESESEFKKAIQTDSTYATAHQWYAFLLATTGRLNEAMEVSQTAHRLDPLSKVIADNVCARAGMLKDYTVGDEVCPQALPMLDGPALYKTAQGKWAEAADLWNRYGESYSAQGFSAYCLVHAGRIPEAREKLKRFLAKNEPMNASFTYIALNKKDSALLWLERSVDMKESALRTTAPLLISHMFDPLRGDPRFEKQIDRMGLRPYAKTGSN